MRVPFVTFKPLEKELDSELQSAFRRVYESSWYIEGEEGRKYVCEKIRSRVRQTVIENNGRVTQFG